MKKTMLSSVLLSLLSITAYADLTEPSATNRSDQNDTIASLPFDGGVNGVERPNELKDAITLAQNNTPSKTKKTKNILAAATPTTATHSTTPATTPPAAEPSAPANIVPDTKVAPTSTTPIAPNAPTAPTTTPTSSGTAPQTTAPAPMPAVLDCNYHIPSATPVDQTLLLKWSEKAVQQSFEFDHQSMTEQLTALKACYTDQGWQSFNDALQKSGNIDAIKSQSLTVSSMMQGTPTISVIKENQWKVSLPLQVVYQNDKDKLTQSLTVDLTVGRKSSGDLGIMQIIASPRTNQTIPTSPSK